MNGDTVVFEVEGVAHEIDVTDAYAPQTLRRILAALPAMADIHCAKIAGCHIMWPVPVVARLETSSDVLSMPPGSFFFWPERQYLEITYDELQAESAAISYLGRLKGDVAWLRDYADANRRGQGQKKFEAKVYVKGGPTEPALATFAEGTDAWSRLRAARQSAWQSQPSDVQGLLDRRGLMIPFGPLAMAEGEMRKLHELLWRLWVDEERHSPDQKSAIARFAIEAALTRVAGFCHMTHVGSVLEDGLSCLEDAHLEQSTVLEELVLYCGRIAAWLDLHICWWPMNELTLDAQERTQA